MSELVPIGRFSRMTGLSVKALRHHQDVGLLEPTKIDESSGYRCYRTSQAGGAETIRSLRAVDMSLDDIAEVLFATDSDLGREVPGSAPERLLERLEDQTRMLTYLERIISQEGRIVRYDIRVKEVPATPVVGTRVHTSLATIGQDLPCR